MDQITEIKQKIDIIDLIQGYVPLKKSGRNYKGLCPFHSEKTPSFMVSQELQIFKCFGCGESGDIFKFVEKVEGVDFPQALERLAEKAGIKLEKTSYDPNSDKRKSVYELNNIANKLYQYILLKHPAGKKALDYVKNKRKITDEVIAKFGLGYAPDKWDTLYNALTKKGFKIQDIVNAGLIVPRTSGGGFYDKFRGRVMIPLTELDGKVAGFTGRDVVNKDPKYLNSPETPVFHKSSFLFALDKAKVAIKKEGAIIVEGQMDTIAAHQFGFDNVVASGGTALTVAQLKILARYTKDLILCFDSDFAGTTAIARGIQLAEKENFNVKVIIIPAPYKDIDELLHGNLTEAKQIIKSPIPIYDFYLATAFKRNDKTTALGKKKIMEELAEIFSQISNKVILDHYSKKIAEDLNLDDETVKSLINGKISSESAEEAYKTSVPTVNYALSKKSPQEYMLALLLKAPLDTSQPVLYKLGQKDFSDPQIQEIFTNLKDYLLGRKHKFKIEYFNNRLEQTQQEIVNDLYLWDLGDILDDDTRLGNELEDIFERIKKDTAKRELRELSDKLKQAELEKDAKQLKELTEKIKNISEKLV